MPVIWPIPLPDPPREKAGLILALGSGPLKPQVGVADEDRAAGGG